MNVLTSQGHQIQQKEPHKPENMLKINGTKSIHSAAKINSYYCQCLEHVIVAIDLLLLLIVLLFFFTEYFFLPLAPCIYLCSFPPYWARFTCGGRHLYISGPASVSHSSAACPPLKPMFDSPHKPDARPLSNSTSNNVCQFNAGLP